VLIVNRQLLPSDADRPSSVMDLADAQWAGRCGVALPLFGTTATHFTVLIQHLGDATAETFLRQVARNAVVVSGNKQVAIQVASGQLAWGLTDTDDALIEMDAGMPVEIIYPDQRPEQMGALRIPNTVAVIAGGPHPVAAAQMANYLVSEKTEGRLAMGASGQFPIRPEHPESSRAQQDPSGKKLPIRWMDVDYSAAADIWPQANEKIRSIFRK